MLQFQETLLTLFNPCKRLVLTGKLSQRCYYFREIIYGSHIVSNKPNKTSNLCGCLRMLSLQHNFHFGGVHYSPFNWDHMAKNLSSSGQDSQLYNLAFNFFSLRITNTNLKCSSRFSRVREYIRMSLINTTANISMKGRKIIFMYTWRTLEICVGDSEGKAIEC